MSSKPTAEELPEHFEQRKTLIMLEAAIEALEVHTLDAAQLNKLNIKRQRMNLDTNSDLRPRFFAPRPNHPPTDEVVNETVDYLHDKDAFTDPTSRAYHLERGWSSYTSSDLRWRRDNNLWRGMGVCYYTPFKELYKYDKPDFGVFNIMDIPTAEFPHMKAVTWNGLEGEDSELGRGELLIILRLMLGQLRKVRLLHHNVSPILVVSFMGKRARLLESFFEDQSFIVRTSDVYDFSDKKTTSMAFKSFAEYYHGDPAGNTL
ncbi:unnamed protein product [Penicillium glandicola]